MLSERAGSVLNILIDQYVNTAAPVASEDIARRSATKVSPATVRSAMSQLAEEGYLSRPHVSAGGIPSDMGLRDWAHPNGLREGDERRTIPVSVHEPIDRGSPRRYSLEQAAVHALSNNIWNNQTSLRSDIVLLGLTPIPSTRR